MSATAKTLTTAVIGAGYMGGGIAQVLALAGHHVMLADVDQRTSRTALRRLIEQAKDFEARGLMPVGAEKTIRQNLFAANSVEDAVAGSDYITEAIPELLELKLEMLARISGACRPSAIIATNTSAISISDLAKGVTNRERFLGVHWMNPAPFIPGVELVAGEDTAPETTDVVEELIVHAGKMPTRVADTPGFIANRLQFSLYKEAVQMLEEGVATAAQIDAVVTNSFGFRLALFGPIAIGDMAGLDVYRSAFHSLAKAYGTRFRAPKSLVQTVDEGNIGLKSGHGFLDIDAEEAERLVEYRDHAYARLSQLRAELGKAPGL